MKKLLLIFSILTTTCLFAFPSTGDGSDGACDFPATTSFNKTEYNCTTMVVSGNIFSNINHTAPITIKVQQSVVIDATIDVTGLTGSYAGSFAGSTVHTNDGEGPGAISGGSYGLPAGVVTGAASGGGGGGGQHASSIAPTSGEDGVPQGGSFSTPGAGGASGSPNFGPAESLEIAFSSNQVGGAGGGVGGEGYDGTIAVSGLHGGNGGGAIRIIAGGTITVTSSGAITSNGGNGGSAASTFGGSGGGGAGGTIFLQALKQIHIDGQLRSLGGSGGVSNAGIGGSGGDGGAGVIRLDDADGEVTGDIQPAAYLQRSSPKMKHTDTIACGTITDIGSANPPWGNLISTLLGFMVIYLIAQFQKLRLIPIRK